MKARFVLFLLLIGSFAMAIAGCAIAFLQTIGGSKERAFNVIIGNDQTLNAAFGGSEDETISSRAYRATQEGRTWGCVLCKLLNFVEKDHCRNSAGV